MNWTELNWTERLAKIWNLGNAKLQTGNCGLRFAVCLMLKVSVIRFWTSTVMKDHEIDLAYNKKNVVAIDFCRIISWLNYPVFCKILPCDLSLVTRRCLPVVSIVCIIHFGDQTTEESIENWNRNPLYYSLNILKNPIGSFWVHIFPENFHLKRGGILARSIKMRDKLPLRAECIW